MGGASHFTHWVVRKAAGCLMGVLAGLVGWLRGDAVLALTSRLTDFVLTHWIASVEALGAAFVLLLCWIMASSIRDALQRRNPGDHIAMVVKKLFPKEVSERIVGEMVSDLKVEYRKALENNSTFLIRFWITFKYRVLIATGIITWMLLETVEFARRLVFRRPPPSI